MKRNSSHRPGVFCLEGYWPIPFSAKSTLYKLQQKYGVDFLYKGPVTLNQFWNGIELWLSEKSKQFPILLLAFHDEPGRIYVGDEAVTLEQIADFIKGRGAGKWLHVSSCLTLKINSKRLSKFIADTNLDGVSGYERSIS